MKIIDSYGNYQVLQYDENLVAIDFSDDDIGVTIQTFNNLDHALSVFNNTVKKLSSYKAKFHNTEIIKQIIS